LCVCDWHIQEARRLPRKTAPFVSSSRVPAHSWLQRARQAVPANLDRESPVLVCRRDCWRSVTASIRLNPPVQSAAVRAVRAVLFVGTRWPLRCRALAATSCRIISPSQAPRGSSCARTATTPVLLALPRLRRACPQSRGGPVTAAQVVISSATRISSRFDARSRHQNARGMASALAARSEELQGTCGPGCPCLRRGLRHHLGSDVMRRRN
jgi:hypothetical protein